MTWKNHPDLEDHKIDHVENILQPNGGVNPKACQVCERSFESKLIENKTGDMVAVGIVARVIHEENGNVIVVCQDCEKKI